MIKKELIQSIIRRVCLQYEKLENSSKNRLEITAKILEKFNYDIFINDNKEIIKEKVL